MANALVFIWGWILGICLNICIYCLPRELSMTRLLFCCPGCGQRLRPADLATFVFLKGKYRCCGEKIPRRFPGTVLLNAVGWMLIIRNWGFSQQGITYAFLFSAALVIALIDMEHCIIPDILVLTLLTGGIAYHFINPGTALTSRLLGLAAAFGTLLLLALISKGGMGGGDIKLSAAIGFWLGFPLVFYSLFTAALTGAITCLLLLGAGIIKRKEPIPFGPFLMLGFLLVLFSQEICVSWYWNLFKGQ